MNKNPSSPGGSIRRFFLPALLSAAGLMTAMPASAVLVEFSYEFSASRNNDGTPGPGGQVLSGVVDGTLLADGDTVVINEFVSASLDGFDYAFSAATGIRAGVFGSAATLTLSGDFIDFWVCPGGFNASLPAGGPLNDCPFGQGGGGFLLTDIDIFGIGNGVGLAGAPVFGAGFRARDRDGLIKSNWSAGIVSVPAPGALALLGAGLFGFGFSRRRRA